jgi:hypothetical protein
MVVIIMALMVAPVFAISESEYDNLPADEKAKYVKVTKDGVTIYEPVAADINDISVEMKDGKIELEGFGSGDQSSIWSNIFAKYKTFIAGISGIAAITMLVFFILNFMKLGASSGNPQARQQALMGVLWTGLAAAGLGAVSIFFGFFYSILL